ncbi:MAG: T6SS effector amidase Tae4 family protein [Bacteroidota bacterium]
MITSTGTVTAGSDVSFIAADSIVLKAGFSAKHDFLAKINPNAAKVRHYCNGIEYFEGEMESIYHEVGRVFFEENLPVYEYTLSDHLGNTRVVFRDDGTGNAQEVQQNDYYAFGLAFEMQEDRYNYKYNGIEDNRELSLDWSTASFRSYDAAIGRWLQVDALSEAMFSMTPYRFGFNNPVNFSDHLGLWEEDEEGNLTTNDAQEIAEFISAYETVSATGGEINYEQVDEEGVAFTMWSMGDNGSAHVTLHNNTNLNAEKSDLSLFVPLSEQQQTAPRPTFDELWSNYFRYGNGVNIPSNQKIPNDMSYRYLGGKVLQNSFSNSCALRTSYSLNAAGYCIPYVREQTISGDAGNWYFFRVADLGRCITKVYGEPDVQSTNISDFIGKKGIIQFEIRWIDATGHFTLWNKNQVAGGNYSPSEYFQKATNVKLWILE